jgi:hypothetical protein
MCNVRRFFLPIKTILKSLRSLGCHYILIKKLSPNDNSKNQVYIGGEKAIQYLPFISSELVKQKSKKKTVSQYIFRSKLNFHWITETGVHKAPHAKIIFYPQYPESRFSGFLKGCKESPNHIIGQKLEDRFLIFSFNQKRESFGYVNFIDKSFNLFLNHHFAKNKNEIFFESTIDKLLNIQNKKSIDSSIEDIKSAIRNICNKGWISSKKFNNEGHVIPHKAPNGGGVTLETELGVRANSETGPDYMGWEIKQHSGRPITLFTPEPDGGKYKENGIAEFIKQYGYPDKNGKKDRLNFGGIYRVSESNYHHLTQLKLSIHGFNKGQFTSKDGHIGLKNKDGETVAYWSFTKLLLHWQKKHAKTCYVKSERIEKAGQYFYKYSTEIELGIESSFINFLLALENGIIYFDPASKLYKENGLFKTKARSQFRMKEENLKSLYKKYLKIKIDK